MWGIRAISLATLVAAAVFFYNVENDRAVFEISGIGFDQFPLVANKRNYITVRIKNIGRNFGSIEAAATDREDKLPAEPTYDPANIAPVQIEGGKELEIISDVGVKPLIFTPAEIAGLSNGNARLKIAGFVEYADRYWLGSGIVGFCYIWDHTVTNFTVCSEKNYTYHRRYFVWNGIQIRDRPMLTVGPQTLTPTMPQMQAPDPRFPIQTLSTRTK
jgi:hypothetical protein